MPCRVRFCDCEDDCLQVLHLRHQPPLGVLRGRAHVVLKALPSTSRYPAICCRMHQSHDHRLHSKPKYVITFLIVQHCFNPDHVPHVPHVMDSLVSREASHHQAFYSSQDVHVKSFLSPNLLIVSPRRWQPDAPRGGHGLVPHSCIVARFMAQTEETNPPHRPIRKKKHEVEAKAKRTADTLMLSDSKN